MHGARHPATQTKLIRTVAHHNCLEFLLAAPVVIVVLAAIDNAIARTTRARVKALLTDRGRAARGSIERVLPNARIHVQVSIGALLQRKGGYDLEEATRNRYKYPQKIVGFVSEYRTSGAILGLVELDDRSHDAFGDRNRDAMTASACYRTVRLPVGRLTTADISARLQPLQPCNPGTSTTAARGGA